VCQARPVYGTPHAQAAYAVKVLKDQWQRDRSAIGCIQREALVGRRLVHPNLVSVLSAHVSDAPHYIVMPWLDGATLQTRIERGSRLALPVVLWVTRQVAQALDALYRTGWMHADVKPDNIFMSREGHATLIDLGFARRFSEESTSAADRYVLGTMEYMAPEMITSALRPDIRSDIYSLGVTAFQLLSGRLPFSSRSVAELAQQHCQAEPPDLQSLVPTISISVAQLIRQMLAKEMLRRPQTPAELVSQLVKLEIETFAEREL
jgi:serine/threonine-protein kinase